MMSLRQGMKRYIIMSKDFESIVERIQKESDITILDSGSSDVILVEMEEDVAKMFRKGNVDLLIEEDIKYKIKKAD
jgi:hypothetical protein